MVIFIYCFGNDSEHSPVSWNVLIFLHFLLLQCVFGWHGILQDLNDPFLYYLRLSDQRFLNRCLDHSGCQNLGIFYVCYFMRHVLFIFITISPQPNPKTLFSFQRYESRYPHQKYFYWLVWLVCKIFFMDSCLLPLGLVIDTCSHLQDNTVWSARYIRFLKSSCVVFHFL